MAREKEKASAPAVRRSSCATVGRRRNSGSGGTTQATDSAPANALLSTSITPCDSGTTSTRWQVSCWCVRRFQREPLAVCSKSAVRTEENDREAIHAIAEYLSP